MPKTDLTDDELAAVVAHLKRFPGETKYPFDPALRPLKDALLKLDPASAPKTRPVLPPLPTGPMVGSRRKPKG